MSNTGARAAYIERIGPPEVIRVGTVPERALTPMEVRVAVIALAVNPVDAYIRSGWYPTAMPWPFIVGRDLVGTVVEIGSSVSGFTVGDTVWCNSLGHDGRQGAFAERVTVPAERLYHLPPAVDPVHAVAALHPAATAWLGLFRKAQLSLGETALIGGGAGNVGRAVIQMAAATGARVIATARPDDHAACRAAGASAVIDYRAPDLVEQVKAVAPDGVDVYWDTSGHNNLTQALSVLTHRGRLIVTAAKHADARIPLRALYLRGIRVAGFVLSDAGVADLAAAAGVINDLLQQDQIAVRVSEVRPLDDTADIHQRIESGAVRGRIVVHPTASP